MRKLTLSSLALAGLSACATAPEVPPEPVTVNVPPMQTCTPMSALTRVTMIGNDMQLDPGLGTCGKQGQGVPVGVGQPSMRINALTVGGTAV